MTRPDARSPVRLLYLEDDPRDVELARAGLADGGLAHELHVVEDRKSFEAALAGGGFDAILLDYSLRGYEGISAVRRVRELRPELPVIFVSGPVGDEKAVELLKEGATDYVLKDGIARLVPSIRQALRTAEAERRRREAERAQARRLRQQEELVALAQRALSEATLDGLLQHAVGAVSRTCELELVHAVTPADPPGRLRLRAGVGWRPGVVIGETTIPAGRGSLAGLALQAGEVVACDDLASDPRFDPAPLLVEHGVTNGVSAPIGGFGALSAFTRRAGPLPDDERAFLVAVAAVLAQSIQGRRSHELHQAVLESIDDAILLTDETGRIGFACPNAQVIFRCSASELEGGHIDDVLGPELFDPARLEAEGELVNIERCVTDRRGGEHTLLVTVKQVGLEAGRRLYACRDATELLEALQALATSEERLRHSFEAARLAAWEWSIPDDRITWSAAEACALFGVEPGELPERYESFLALLWPRDAEALRGSMARALADTGADSYLTEYRIGDRPPGTSRRAGASRGTPEGDPCAWSGSSRT